LQDLRIAAGFESANKFAEHLQIPPSTYTGYEQGKGMFTYERAWEMADALQCSMDELGGRQWPPEGMNDPITPEEREIVDNFRRTSEDDRSSFVQTSRLYAYAGDAKKEGLESPAPVAEGQVVKS